MDELISRMRRLIDDHHGHFLFRKKEKNKRMSEIANSSRLSRFPVARKSEDAEFIRTTRKFLDRFEIFVSCFTGEGREINSRNYRHTVIIMVS